MGQMKYATLIALVAIVKAEEGVTCDESGIISDDSWVISEDATVTGATDDAEACGVALTTAAEADTDNDWCGHAITTTTDGTPATVCNGWTLATAEGNDARVETADTPDADAPVANEAWAWTAGVAMEDFIVADEDAANMITAAVAAVATIAAVAL